MSVTALDARIDAGLREFMSPLLSPQRFFIVTVEDSPQWFALLDRQTPCPLCDSGFRCVGTFDRKIDALIECVARNDEEEKDIL